MVASSASYANVETDEKRLGGGARCASCDGPEFNKRRFGNKEPSEDEGQLARMKTRSC